jgi:beta-lactamase superfamily II metal-dependent hydrolase
MSDSDRGRIIRELQAESKGKNVVRFISTHPDDDHIRNLVYLHHQMNLLNFYCVRNEATKDDETKDFRQYCTLRDDPKKSFYLFRGCTRRWMNLSDKERDVAGINILWPILKNEHYQEALARAKDGDNPNNICPIVSYSLENGATIVWMGDLENNFMDNIVNEIIMPQTDILFVPHHGRSSGHVPVGWLYEMRPKLIVVGEAPAEYLDYYSDYQTITQNSAGDITFDCVTRRVHIYVSSRYYSVDFLADEGMAPTYDYYVGSLKV